MHPRIRSGARAALKFVIVRKFFAEERPPLGLETDRKVVS
jgi:hypothetical protein